MTDAAWLTECSRRNLGTIKISVEKPHVGDFSFQETGSRTVEPNCRTPTSTHSHNSAQLRTTSDPILRVADNSDLAITDHEIFLIYR